MGWDELMPEEELSRDRDLKKTVTEAVTGGDSVEHSLCRDETQGSIPSPGKRKHSITPECKQS